MQTEIFENKTFTVEKLQTAVKNRFYIDPNTTNPNKSFAISNKKINQEPEFIQIPVPDYQIGDSVRIERTIEKDGIYFRGECWAVVTAIKLTYDGYYAYTYSATNDSSIFNFRRNEVKEKIAAKYVQVIKKNEFYGLNDSFVEKK